MPILRDRVQQNVQDRVVNESQADTREMRRSLRLHRQLSGKRRELTIAATSSEVVVHGLGYIPRGWQVESGNNNAITVTRSDKESITFANGAATEAAITVWIY